MMLVEAFRVSAELLESNYLTDATEWYLWSPGSIGRASCERSRSDRYDDLQSRIDDVLAEHNPKLPTYRPR